MVEDQGQAVAEDQKPWPEPQPWAKTPIIHSVRASLAMTPPNVDTNQVRRAPLKGALVFFGALAEPWQPTLRFPLM